MNNAGADPSKPPNPKPPPAAVMEEFDTLPQNVRAAVRDAAIDIDPRAVKRLIDTRGIPAALSVVAAAR